MWKKQGVNLRTGSGEYGQTRVYSNDTIQRGGRGTHGRVRLNRTIGFYSGQCNNLGQNHSKNDKVVRILVRDLTIAHLVKVALRLQGMSGTEISCLFLGIKVGIDLVPYCSFVLHRRKLGLKKVFNIQARIYT